MAITFIASAGNFAAGSGTVLDCSAPLNVQANDILVCSASWATTDATPSVAESGGGNSFSMNTKYVASTPGYLNMGLNLIATANATSTFRLTLTTSVTNRAIVVMQFRPGAGENVVLDNLNKGNTGTSTVAKSLNFATVADSVAVGSAVNAAAVGYLFELMGADFADGFLRQGNILTEFYEINSLTVPVAVNFAEADPNSSTSWVADAVSFHSAPEFGISDTAPSGLADTTTYYFKVNGTEYNILTGTNPTYGDVATLIDTALDPNFGAKMIGTAPEQDIRVFNEAIRGSGSECTLSNGTTSPDLFVNLNFWSSFRKVPVFALEPASESFAIERTMDGSIFIDGNALIVPFIPTEGAAFYNDIYYLDEYYGE